MYNITHRIVWIRIFVFLLFKQKKTRQQLRWLARLFFTNELSCTLQPFSKLSLKEIYRCSSHLIDNASISYIF